MYLPKYLIFNSHFSGWKNKIFVTFPCVHLGLPIFTKVPPSLATPEQHSTFQQTCQAEGFPPPKLSWKRLGQPLPVAKTEVKEGNLTIRNLSPTDSGLYECVATNSMGTKKTRINVVVQRKPGLCFLKTKTAAALRILQVCHSEYTLNNVNGLISAIFVQLFNIVYHYFSGVFSFTRSVIYYIYRGCLHFQHNSIYIIPLFNSN